MLALSRSILLSPPKMNIFLSLNLLKQLFSDSVKCGTLPEGCLYTDPTVMVLPLYFRSINIDSAMHFGQFKQFNLTLFSLTSISSKSSLLINIPAPLF